MVLRLRFWAAAALAALTFRKRLRGFSTLMTDWATGRPAADPPPPADDDADKRRDEVGGADADADESETAVE